MTVSTIFDPLHGGILPTSSLPAAAWADITGKPAVIAAGADQAAARTAIGAGTSSLAIGTTNTTAMAGDKAPVGTDRGGVLLQTAQANSVAIDVAGLVTDFNALLVKLRSAGILAP